MYYSSKVDSDATVYIDVNGVELYNFWREQKSFILQLPKYKVRMIVQNPFSPHFSDMMKNEIMNEESAKDNILKLTREVKRLNESGNNNIEIRWMSFPASITMTRVNNQLYVRARLINATHRDERHFFEKYITEDKPFSTYIQYFEDAWEKFETDLNAQSKFGEL